MSTPPDAPDAVRPAPWVTDVVLGLSLALLLALVIAVEPDGDDAAAYGFALLFGVLVLLRRRATRTTVVLTVLAVFTYYALDLAPIGMALPAVAALYSAAELHRTGWAVGAGAVLLTVSTYFRVVGDDRDILTVYDLVTNVALVAAAIALGVAVRLTREARERTEVVRMLTAAEQARTAEGDLQAERMRIARDLHDVIGHNLSVVALHTGVAAEAVGRDDDSARTALRHVHEATSSTLHELRATVRVLRRPDPPSSGTRDTLPAATGPAGLSSLVEPARAAGLRVTTRVDVPAGSIDATVDAAAYRIVQEALTNVLRHAAARQTLVRLTVTDGRLRITVVDDGVGSGGGHEPGAGLAGMTERASLLGGSLTAGDGTDGGFTVSADLPARLEG